MTLDDREKYITDLFDECIQVLDKKGKDYSGTEDALSNFKLNGERLGLSKYQILSVYMNKHLDSITRSIQTSPTKPQVESEPLRGRIVDAINYLAILGAMLHEDT